MNRSLSYIIVPILMSAAVAQPQTFPGSPGSIHWQELLPQVRQVLHLPATQQDRVGIAQTADITGDGIPEALVDLGDGGASTEYFTLMRIQNGKPVQALFKGRDGKVTTGHFQRGASVRHGESVQMLPLKQTIYSMSTSADDAGGSGTCTVTAYEWNAQKAIFLWNRALSRQVARSACPKRSDFF